MWVCDQYRESEKLTPTISFIFEYRCVVFNSAATSKSEPFDSVPHIRRDCEIKMPRRRYSGARNCVGEE